MKLPTAVAVGVTLLIAMVALAAIGTFAYYAKALFLKYPLIWPDEALIANPAMNLIQRGAMAVDLLSGTLPGIEQRTYWMPPLHYLYLSGVFYLWGPSVIAMRLSSVGAATAAMGLTYSLGVRSGLGRWLSLVPVSLLAVDVAFLRAALIGRPDMLAVALILLALFTATGASNVAGALTPRRPFLTGVTCALAAMTHPLGAAPPLAVVLVWGLSYPGGSRRRVLGPMLAGFFLPLLPWALYISQDPKSFLAQFGGQIMRKAATNPYGFLSSLTSTLSQPYGLPLGLLAGLICVTGFIGLCSAAQERRELLILPVCQVVILAVMGSELWYLVYALPMTALGMGHLIGLAGSKLSSRTIPAFFAMAVVIWFAQGNVSRLSRMNLVQNGTYGGRTNYAAWCQRIGRAIPRGSKVLLAVIPDPYFGLMDRPDLVLREFVPEKIPVDADKYWRYMAGADYIVVGCKSPSASVDRFVQLRGQLIAEVGVPLGEGYCGRIFKVGKQDAPGPVDKYGPGGGNTGDGTG